MPLIVIHGDDAIEGAGVSAGKERVSWPGTGCVDSLSSRGIDSWTNDPLFLIPKEAAIAGMGVEGGDTQARPAAEDAAHQGVEQADFLKHSGA